MDGAGVDRRGSHSHEGISIEHLSIVKPGVRKAQLLSTFNDLPGIGCGRDGDTKIHGVAPSYVERRRRWRGLVNAWLVESQQYAPGNIFAGASAKIRYNLSHGHADKYTVSPRGT